LQSPCGLVLNDAIDTDGHMIDRGFYAVNGVHNAIGTLLHSLLDDEGIGGMNFDRKASMLAAAAASRRASALARSTLPSISHQKPEMASTRPKKEEDLLPSDRPAQSFTSQSLVSFWFSARIWHLVSGVILSSTTSGTARATLQ
jgi:hypothetical protein